MIKFSGHTMGVPKLNLREALEFFKTLGYDGAEIRVASDGQINSETLTNQEAADISAFASQLGIQFSCLTSYYQDLISTAKRQDNIEKFKRVVEIADILHCPLVRSYGGCDPCKEGIRFEDNWELTASGIAEVARYAGKFGIKIAIETHIGSLTMSARSTMRMIEDVNMPNVGMLLDYAWVDFAGIEKPEEVIRRCARSIFHFHVKDWKLESRYPVKKTSCLMGQGTIPWPTVLRELVQSGYNGYITDEYEKFWYPDQLPHAEVGMKHNLAYVRDLIHTMQN